MKTVNRAAAAVLGFILAFSMVPLAAFAEQPDLSAGQIAEAPADGSGAASVLTSVYALGADDDLVEAGNIDDALEAAGVDLMELASQGAGGDGFVVVIDPGHGGYDGGAQGHVSEKVVNLAISKYCKAKLEQYPGVTVYMTREDDTFVELSDRVQFAVAHDADLLLCLHNNSTGSGVGKGAEVIVPRNVSWAYEVAYVTGWELGAKIMEKLNGLGLSTHQGVWSRNGSGTYPDGSACDYYAIVRGARQAGMLGIIVEHAFVDNADDGRFLSDENNLKALGEADAEAVIEYYNNSDAINRLYWGVYDYGYYLQHNPDALQSTDGSALSVLGYFKSTGMAQGQRGNVLLDVAYYKGAYEDLQAAYGDDLPAYYRHFIKYGLKEGRRGSAEFSPADYKANYGDLQAAFGNDWPEYYRHYLKFGIDEGRVADRPLEGSGDPQPAQPSGPSAEMHRLYNPNSGEHFYTEAPDERDFLQSAGWVYEGIAWVGPVESESPVYRLYNPYAGDHHYTLDAGERDALAEVGWNDEGIGWYSDDNQTVPLYRLYNPNARTGTHHYTVSFEEAEQLVIAGWAFEGVSWYGQSAGTELIDASTLQPDRIMGPSRTTPAQMVRRYNSVGASYPSHVYTKYGAATIDDFCRILYEEAQAEGVRAEVVFAQAMHETGWLRYGNDVMAEQCNFAGLGATGGVSGNAFNSNGTDSVRIGLRAQVQHLKAYASTAPLNQELVDVRFSLVERGCAPSVYDLGGRWAVDTSYGSRLMDHVNVLLAS